MYWQYVITYCGLGFVQMICILCTGLLLLQIFKIQAKTPFEQVFYALCAGIYTWIFITAVLFTQGKTVFIGTLPLVALLLWIHYSNTNAAKLKIKQFSYKNLFRYTLILAGVWLWTSLLNMYCISVDGNHLYLPHFDILHSIEISQYVQKTGTETYYWWQNNSKTFPYHYAEIWLHAGIQTLWHTQKTWTWQSIVMPLLQTTLITGLLAIAEQRQKKIGLFTFFAAGGFILFNGWLNLSLPHFDHHFDFTRYTSMIGAAKFVVIGIFCVLYVLSKNVFKPFILMLLPIFSVLTLPAILTWILWQYLQIKSKKILLGLLLLLIWLIGFYFFTGQGSRVNIPFTKLLPEWHSYFWQTILYFVLISIVFYLPVFFGLREKSILKDFAVILVVSYVLFLIFYAWYDSYQFIVLLWLPLVWAYSWVIFMHSNQKHVQFIFWCMIAFSVWQTFLYKRDFQRTAIHNAWIQEVYTYLDTHNLLQQGAALEYYDSRQMHVFIWQKNEVKLLPLLAQPMNYDGITQKSPLDTLNATLLQKSFLFQPKNNSKSIAEQVFTFCREHNIRFLIYPSKYKFDEVYKEYILHCFENEQDKLTCIVFKKHDN